jgi:hypothetical protein
MNKKNILIVTGIILASVVLRLLFNEMNWFNLVPIAALGIFSGSILKNKTMAYLIPFGAMFVTDIFFQLFTETPGFYSFAQIFTYGAVMLVTLMGTKLNPKKGLSILGFTVGGSLVFFLISNFGVWTEGLMYPRSLAGLVECFGMALPFYKSEFATQLFVNSFGADLIFSCIAFGIYNYSFESRGTLTPIRVKSNDNNSAQ